MNDLDAIRLAAAVIVAIASIVASNFLPRRDFFFRGRKVMTRNSLLFFFGLLLLASVFVPVEWILAIRDLVASFWGSGAKK